MSNINMRLTDKAKWLLFRALVCESLTNAGFKGDSWEFSGDLDMSFDDIKDKPINNWTKLIRKDLEDYKRDRQEDFL